MDKQRWEESERRREAVRRSERRKSEKKEDAFERKGAKVTSCGAKQISKSKCTKHTNVGPLLEVELSKKCTTLWREAHLFPSQNVQSTPFSDHFWKLRCRESCTLLWREAHFQVKTYKAHHSRTTFGSSHVEKVHAVVARSTCPSQNVQNTPGSDHF